MYFRGFNQLSNLLLVFRINNQIGHTFHVFMFDRKHFFLRVSMTVPKTYFAIVAQLLFSQKLP